MKHDIHQSITDSIIEAIENGQGDFTLPWIQNYALPVKLDGSPYRGINILQLWAKAHKFGYLSNQWGGFKSWSYEGGQVRKGERSTQIIYYKILEKENKTGEIDQLPMIRYFNVWNRDQIDGLPEIELPADAINKTGIATEVVNTIARVNDANVVVSGQKAYYQPCVDTITMPLPELFIEQNNISADVGYASTLGHELIHWTGSTNRLNRESDPRVKEDYSFEELVAELGAAFLCGQLKFNYSGVADHAGYINSWLTQLRDDKKAIFRAASQASKAVDYLTIIPGI